VSADPLLAQAIRERLSGVLIVQTPVELVRRRSKYRSVLVER
jgi:hypothetical protein